MAEPIDWDGLIEAARAARQRAHAPYSRFAVGAALQSVDGHIVVGCNVENVAFPSSQCAEASAIGALVSMYGVRSIGALVVVGGGETPTWPCGNCRQMLAEFAAADCQVRSVTGDRRSASVALADLLPHAFDRFESADG